MCCIGSPYPIVNIKTFYFAVQRTLSLYQILTFKLCFIPYHFNSLNINNLYNE